MNALHSILFALIQGATELFPVSSLGHAVIVPALFHWNINQAAPSFLPFIVMLHVGTAAALLLYFWRTWWEILLGVLGRGNPAAVAAYRALLLKLIIATLPAVVIGFALKKSIRHLFASPVIAAVFLIVNAGLLLLGERLRRRDPAGRPATRFNDLTMMDALVIGFFQCLAFLPGISRSGAAIVGGLTRGVDHEGAAGFAFLMATPVIAGATVVEVPKLVHNHQIHGLLGLALLAAIIAGITAFASTAFLMRYFRNHDNWALKPFATYCAAAGLLSIILLSLGY